jgi:hypothetical protein
MNDPVVSREQMLHVCGQASGDLRPYECIWLYEAAARLRPGGHSVELGYGQGRPFLAAGLGLPSDCRLLGVSQVAEGSSNPLGMCSSEESLRNVARLHELRPDLRITAGDADLVFVQASQNVDWMTAQLEVWRSKLVPGFR